MAVTATMPTPTNPDGSKQQTFSVKSLKDAGDLTSRFRQMKAARAMIDIQWRLNLAYYQGRQYTYYNRNAGRIEELPTSDGEKPRYRIRLKSNQIMPGTQGLLAKLVKTKPVINATSGSSSPADVRAAQMSERLLEFLWDDLHLDEKLSEALLWAIVASQGYWRITWDDQAGKPIKFVLDPQGNPITDQSLKQIYLQELAQQGIPQEQVEKTFYMGDVRVETISPFNVLLDPAQHEWERCAYACVVSNMDCDEVYARWGQWLQPDSNPNADDSVTPTQGFGSYSNAIKTTVRILTWYFKPTTTMPKGRVVVHADTAEKILDDTAWPFPTNELPLIKFGMLKVPGSIYDSSVVEHAIPLQQELNRTISQIVEYKNLTIKPRIWAPTGSLRQRITNEPGAVYEFTPIGGFKPEIEQLPSMPPYVFNHLEDISARLKDAFYISEVEGGSLPPNVEAFTAIDLLQEMSSDKIAPSVKLMEKSLGAAGQQILSLAQKYYVEPRLLAIKGANGSPQVKQFSKADIAGGITVAVESGSGLPRTRAGRIAQIQDLVEKGYISPQQGLKRMGIADLNGPLAAIAADEDQALREHDKLVAGQPINTDALRQAVQTINTPGPGAGVPVNPDTGKPFANPQEMQQYVKEQGLQPTNYEDYATHVDQHGLFMKSVEYEALPPEIQADFVTHYTATREALRNLPIQGVKGPNVNLQIKGTAGPTVTSEILNRAGVYDVSPEQFQEAPMPSWISEAESVTAATAPIDPHMLFPPEDPNGGGGPTFFERELAEPPDPVQQAQAAGAQAQAAATLNSAQNQDAMHLQKMTHAEEMHQQAHHHAHEAHQMKMHAAREALKHKATAAKKEPKDGAKT